jgi:hypothetical protein
MFISIFTLQFNNRVTDMGIFKSFLKKLLTSIVFIATFGFGQPTFLPHDITTNTNVPKTTFPIDLDGDGDLDIISSLEDSNNGDNTLEWFENNGSQSFTQNTLISTHTYITGAISSADLDGDGDLDILAAAYNSIRLYWNNGSQSFSEEIISQSSIMFDVMPIDVDGDGDMDIIASGENEKVIWLENNGANSFTTIVISSANTAHINYTVHAIDMDGDGDIDIVSASTGSTNNKILLFENDGSEYFTQIEVATVNYPKCIYPIDLDNDGDIDIIGSDWDNLYYLLNDGLQNFTKFDYSSMGNYGDSQSIVPGDLDNDNDVDIISSTSDLSTFSWFENNGSEDFTQHTIDSDIFVAENPIYAIDINGDGNLDIVTASRDDGTIVWYENIPPYAGPTWHVATTGSDDNDGSESNPFATIQAGIDAASDGDTVLVAEGTYVENINYNGKNISVIGEDRETTIIDGNNAGRVVTFNSGEDTTAVLSGFSIMFGLGGIEVSNSSPKLDDLIIAYNQTGGEGGGLKAVNSHLIITDCEFYFNVGSYGGGIFFNDTESDLTNVTIAFCSADSASSIFIDTDCILEITNCTFYKDDAVQPSYADEIIYGNDNQFSIKNCIYWTTSNGNFLEKDGSNSNGSFNNICSISFSCINGMSESSSFGSHGTLDWDELTNIGGNPLLCLTDSTDFTLAENSPCVGSGENGADMGAFGVGCESIDISLTINEIMQNPSAVSDSDGEWFEIFNSGDIELDLNGWTIKDAGSDNHTISSSLTINPGEYKVLGVNSNSSSNGGVTVDYQYSGSSNDITLSNGADEIILVDTYGVVFDSVAYDGGPDNDGGIFPDPNGASMALVHPDSNNNVGTNWQESTTSYGDGDLGTPGIPNISSDISIDLTPLDFDTVFVNESGTLDLTITNNGNAPLQIDSLYTSSDLFTLSIDDSLIETSAILSITYTPVEFGPDIGTVYIKSNDPDEGLVQISLSGFGYFTSPDIELSANSINFGGVMDGLTGIQLLHVYNTGDAPLELDTMYCTDNFSVMPSNGTVNLGETLGLEVTFAPDDETSFDGMLTIVAGNDPDEDTLTVSLSGNGTPQAPIISSDQYMVFFGAVDEGETSNQSIILQNLGILDLEIEEISFSGGDTSLFSTTFSDATVEPADSVLVPITFTNQSNTEIYFETVSIISNDNTLDILLIAGSFVPQITGVNAEVSDSVVHVTWNGINNLDGDIIYDDGQFDTSESVFMTNGFMILGALFDLPVTNVMLNTVSVYGDENLSGTTSIYGYALSFDPLDTVFTLDRDPLYSKEVTTTAGQWLEEPVNWAFTGSFIIGYRITTDIALAIDSDAYGQTNSYFLANDAWNDWNTSDALGATSLSGSLSGGEFAIRANVNVDGGNHSYNVYRSLDSGEYILMDDGQNLEDAEYTDNLLDNGFEYCYKVTAVYGEDEGQPSESSCVTPTVYEIAYDDGTAETHFNVGSLNFLCVKFTPNNYPVDLYRTSFYCEGTSTGPGIVHVWDDNGENGSPGDILLNGIPTTFVGNTWKYVSLSEFDITINDGSFYIGMMETELTPPIGLDTDSPSDYSMINIGEGWEPLEEYIAAALMIRVEIDTANAILDLQSDILGSVPLQYSLHHNYPNPFNPVTTLRYDLPETGLVTITIYDMMGRQVKTLVNGSQTAGYRTIQWNATNDKGAPVSAGLYLYTIQAGEFRQTKKMVLLK